MDSFPIITDKTLKSFINLVNIPKEYKDTLLSKLPSLDFDERRALFETLVRIYLFDREEKEVLKEIDKFYKKE